jgi:hypothetical protein
LERPFHPAWTAVSFLADAERTSLTSTDVEIEQKINLLVESVKDDRVRANQLFQYVWSMICVRRGLLRVVRVTGNGEGYRLLLEEVQSGRQRVVIRPAGLDSDIEGLAIQALTRILSDVRSYRYPQAHL